MKLTLDEDIRACVAALRKEEQEYMDATKLPFNQVVYADLAMWEWLAETIQDCKLWQVYEIDKPASAWCAAVRRELGMSECEDEDVPV